MVNLLSANTFTDVAALFLTEALIYMGFLLILNVLSASISGYNYANTEGITKEDIVSLVRLCQDKSRLAWNHTTQTVLEFTKKFLESLYTLCDQMSYVLEVLTKTRPIKEDKSTQTLQNELVFYNPQEPLDEELSALLVSRSFSSWKSKRRGSSSRRMSGQSEEENNNLIKSFDNFNL